MSRKRENVLAPVLFGALGSVFIGSMFKSCELDKVPERIEVVQEHNAQLLDQLEPDFPGMGRLILNDETDTFEFHVASENQPPQVCKGDYEVVEAKAKTAGDIACTTTVTLGG